MANEENTTGEIGPRRYLNTGTVGTQLLSNTSSYLYQSVVVTITRAYSTSGDRAHLYYTAESHQIMHGAVHRYVSIFGTSRITKQARWDLHEYKILIHRISSITVLN